MQQTHPELLKYWQMGDFAGDLITMFVTLPKAMDIIDRSNKLKKQLEVAGVELSEKHKKWFQRVQEELGKLLSPEKARATQVFFGDGTAALPIHNNRFLFNSSLNDAKNNFGQLLRGKDTKELSDALKKHIGELGKTAKGKFREELIAVARALDAGTQSLLKVSIEVERLKLTQGKSVLTGEQLYFLKTIADQKDLNPKLVSQFLDYGLTKGKNVKDLELLLKIADRVEVAESKHLFRILDALHTVKNYEAKKLLLTLATQNKNAEVLATFTAKELQKLAKGILPNTTFGNAKGNFINQKEFFDQLTPEHLKKFKEEIAGKPFKSFDLNFLSSKNLTKISRYDQAIAILKAKGYHFLAKLAADTKNYRTTHDKGVKLFIETAEDKEFYEYLSIFRVDGDPNKLFMPQYKNFGEGMLRLRKVVKDNPKVKITMEQVGEIMKGYERHHQIMFNIMKDNETFQKIMEWALSRKPPLTIGFNEFRENLIILAKKQHGYHNVRTKKMNKKVDKINDVFNDAIREFNMKINKLEDLVKNTENNDLLEEAFYDLKDILQEETETIIKKVIQIQNSKLDDI